MVRSGVSQDRSRPLLICFFWSLCVYAHAMDAILLYRYGMAYRGSKIKGRALI